MPPIAHVPGILLQPEPRWRLIEGESGSAARLLLGYVAVLALIPVAAWVVGVSIIGVPVPTGTFRVPVATAVASVAIGYVASFAIVYLVAFVADALAPTFDSKRNFANALKLSVYSHTPFFVAGIFFLYPRLRFVTYFLGFYGLYLAWVGLPVLLKTPREKSLTFAIAILMSAVIVSIILGIVVNQVSGITGARRTLPI